MTFIIPFRDRPRDAEKVTDPVTGARYLRPRRRPKTPDANSRGGPLPAACTTPFCKKSGIPHDQCQPVQCYQPKYYPYPTPCPTPRYPIDAYARYRPPHPLPQANAYYGADRSAFQRWVQSFPHWRLPREMPLDWTFPGRPDAQGYPVQTMYTPRRHVYYNPATEEPLIPGHPVPYHRRQVMPRQEPAIPFYFAPHHRPQGMSTPMITMPAPASGWPNGAELPNRVSNVIEWNNVQGGRLQWTPHPWVAHPLPHPEIPAQQFWDYAGAGNAGACERWQGPGGWAPGYGAASLDAARMHLITGGHPLPGRDPYWTPMGWAPPSCPFPGSVSISPWLAPNARDANVPHVLWNAAVEPPYTIRRVTGRGTIVSFATTDFFNEPATVPNVTSLRVRLPGMRNSWGPVVINKKSAVTVGDVFNAVWDYLQTPITLDDYQSLLATGRSKEVEYAMYRRCWSSAALYDYMVSQGIKRVDILECNTVYWGFWLTYNPDGTWYLTMGFLPRTRST